MRRRRDGLVLVGDHHVDVQTPVRQDERVFAHCLRHDVLNPVRIESRAGEKRELANRRVHVEPVHLPERQVRHDRAAPPRAVRREPNLARTHVFERIAVEVRAALEPVDDRVAVWIVLGNAPVGAELRVERGRGHHRHVVRHALRDAGERVLEGLRGLRLLHLVDERDGAGPHVVEDIPRVDPVDHVRSDGVVLRHDRGEHAVREVAAVEGLLYVVACDGEVHEHLLARRHGMVGVDDLPDVVVAGRHLDDGLPVVRRVVPVVRSDRHAAAPEVLRHAERIGGAAEVVARHDDVAVGHLRRHPVAHLAEIAGVLDLQRLEVVRALDDDLVLDDAARADELEDNWVVVADDAVGSEHQRRVVDLPNAVKRAVRLLEPSARPRQWAADHPEDHVHLGVLGRQLLGARETVPAEPREVVRDDPVVPLLALEKAHGPARDVGFRRMGNLDELAVLVGVAPLDEVAEEIDLVDPCPARGDVVEDVVRREVPASAVLRVEVERTVPLGDLPVGAVEPVGHRDCRVLLRVEDNLERVLDVRRRGERHRDDGVGARAHGRAVDESVLVRLDCAGEPGRMGGGAVLPVLVAPRRDAVEPVQLDARRVGEVDVRGELGAVDLALHAPRLLADRLLVAARNVRNLAEARHVVPEAADVLEAHDGVDRLAHEHLVEEHARRRVVRARGKPVAAAVGILDNAFNARYGKAERLVLRVHLGAVCLVPGVRHHEHGSVYPLPLALVGLRGVARAVDRNRGRRVGLTVLPRLEHDLADDVRGERRRLYEGLVLDVRLAVGDVDPGDAVVLVDGVVDRQGEARAARLGREVVEEHHLLRVLVSADGADVPAPPAVDVYRRLVAARYRRDGDVAELRRVGYVFHGEDGVCRHHQAHRALDVVETDVGVQNALLALGGSHRRKVEVGDRRPDVRAERLVVAADGGVVYAIRRDLQREDGVLLGVLVGDGDHAEADAAHIAGAVRAVVGEAVHQRRADGARRVETGALGAQENRVVGGPGRCEDEVGVADRLVAVLVVGPFGQNRPHVGIVPVSAAPRL